MGGVFGKPKIGLRRIKVISLLAVGTLVLQRWTAKQPPELLRRFLRSIESWHSGSVLLAALLLRYAYKNAALLLHMDAPDHNVPYSDNFFRAVWVLTAANAAFITASSIETRWLRDIVSLALVPYYLLWHEHAENRMHRYRQATNVAQIRASFEGVPRHPFLKWLAAKRLPLLGVHRRRVLVPRRTATEIESSECGSEGVSIGGIECYLYYRGRAEELPNCSRVVLQFHGGGFVAMDPMCHEDYMCHIASNVDAVFCCVNYRKAPENPYPAGLCDCFDVFTALREDNGRCIGIMPPALARAGVEQPLRIVLMGDSAGGNLAAAVALRVALINLHACSSGGAGSDPLRAPDGVHLIYPTLCFDPPFWRAADILPSDAVPLSSTSSSSSSNNSASEDFEQIGGGNSLSPASLQSLSNPSSAAAESAATATATSAALISSAVTGMRRSASHARFHHHAASGSADATSSHTADGDGVLRLTSLTRPTSFVSLISLVNTAVEQSPTPSIALRQHQSLSKRTASFSSLAAAAASIEPASVLNGAAALDTSPSASTGIKSSRSGSSKLFTQLPKLPMFASHVRFVNDRILGPNRVVAMAEAYLANGGDPSRDMFLSPLIAPAALLEHFPRTFIHVGEVDPLIDDSVLFCKRLQDARPSGATTNRLHIFPGISHAYLHLGLLLPETKEAISLTSDWLTELLRQ